MNMTENKNPLVCDIETGICEAPEETNSSQKKPVTITYFTDPTL